MKIQKGKMLVQDMNLKPGELFQVGTGKSKFVAKYVGLVKHKKYDEIQIKFSH